MSVGVVGSVLWVGCYGWMLYVGALLREGSVMDRGAISGGIMGGGTYGLRYDGL